MKKMTKGIFATGLIATTLSATPAFADNATQASDSENTLSASTKGSVSFKGGYLSLYNVDNSVDFGTADVAALFLSDDATVLEGAEEVIDVDDFQGKGGTYTVSVSKSDWVNAEGKVDAGAKILNDNAVLSLGGKEITTSTAVFSGDPSNNGQDVSLGKYELTLPGKVNYSADSYTTTLTWSLDESVSETQS